MEIEFTQKSELLSDSGRLLHGGWSRSMLLDYNKDTIPRWRRWWRLKQWDSYTFGNDAVQVTLTVADMGYVGLISASVVRVDIPAEKTTTKLFPFTFGKFEMPPSTSDGDIMYRSKEISLDFCKSPGKRYIRMRMEHFDDVRPLYINVVLEQPPMDSMCIALPFEESGDCFLYNHKINCMPASGTVVYGADTYELSAKDSFGCLDWARGVCPRVCEWINISASGLADGVPIGINLGDGSGDRAAAGENIVFCDGVGYKFEQVDIEYDSRDRMKPWHFRSADRRLELTFEPTIERRAAASLPGIVSAQEYRVFGRISGTVNLGAGRSIAIDSLTGFAQEVSSKW